MRSVKLALAIGLGIVAVAVAAVLSESPLTVAASNMPYEEEVANASGNTNACQANERLPQGTVAIRLSLRAFTGPKVTVRALSDGRVVTSGERGSGWAGLSVTIPVKTVSRTISPVTICFVVGAFTHESVTALGEHTLPAHAAHTTNGESLPGRLKIDYLSKGHSSWLTLASSVAKHMGLGRAWSGTWVVLLVLMLMLAALISASRLIVRELHE